jgi:hypothetical protein
MFIKQHATIYCAIDLHNVIFHIIYRDYKRDKLNNINTGDWGGGGGGGEIVWAL